MLELGDMVESPSEFQYCAVVSLSIHMVFSYYIAADLLLLFEVPKRRSYKGLAILANYFINRL